jgi:hypothetical protein
MDTVATDPLALAARAGEVLVRTPGGGKLHIRGCSHLTATSELLVASEQDAGTRELCTACAAELSGQGRTPFDDLDRAMEAFSMPVEVRATVRELVAHVDTDRVWIPYSRSYIALGKDGTRALYIGKTYVWIDGEQTTLPGYAPGGGGGTATNELDSPACPTCRYQLPRTGICDNCT